MKLDEPEESLPNKKDQIGDDEKITKGKEKGQIDDETSSTSELSGTYELRRLSAGQLDVGFPIAYSTQLIQTKSEVEEKKEEKIIKDSWRKLQDKPNWVRRSILRVKRATARPLLPIPNWIRSMLHELQLCWLAGQLGALLWYAIRVDWQLRIRAPIQNLPLYEETKMPWLPHQYMNHFRLGAAFVCHALIYLPIAFGHFMYVLDDCPDETPLQLARKVVHGKHMQNSIRKTRRWSMDPRFDQFLRPKRRQWATGIILLMSLAMFSYFLYLIIFELHFAAKTISWKQTVSLWIFEMQKNYYIDAGEKLGTLVRSEDNKFGKTRRIVDQLQIMFQCCGSSGPNGSQDWFHQDIKKPSRLEIANMLGADEQTVQQMKWNIPLSCCRMDITDCDPSRPEHVNTIGCVEPIFNELIHQWKLLGLKCLLILVVLMVDQAIIQAKTGCAEIYLKLTESKRVAREAVKRAHDLSRRASEFYPRTSIMEQTAVVFEKLQRSKSQLFSKMTKRMSQTPQKTRSA